MPSLSKAATQAESREVLAQMEAMKKRAARQAARGVGATAEIPTVECEILPLGDGRVSMGEHFGSFGDAHYEAGETPTLQLPIAVSLYDKGLVNFEGAKQASADAAEARAQAVRDRKDAERRAREAAEDAE